ncbi:hypothetical protein SLS62_000962 [Diatrype stigma]|uniref:Autophagy-related protein 14 n=1 Tax=Diatrype stigma TaxID=117547 RepID=A0AAN9V0K7_9PEZI
MLPQNRRLRHLQGIYLRNLSFSATRGRAIDDLDAEFKPNSNSNDGSNSHGLEAAEDDAPQIHQSQSTDSFRPRPKGQQRRRSTTLANISPVTRQKQLEYAVESRAADVFFSLHCEGVDEPVYISEVGERAMNFNFRFLDLAHAVAAAQLDPDLDLKEPPVTRSSTFTVKVWARRVSASAWALLLEQHVDLRALHYLGTSLRSRQFPPNCLVFHLSDGGVYALPELASPSSSLSSPSSSEPPPSKKKQSPALPTSSYSALMKLSNLDASIQDALATREALTTQINEILAQSSATTTTAYDKLPQAQESALLASRYLAAQRRTLKAAQARRAELRSSIDARRRAIAEGREAQARAEADVRRAREAELPGLRAQTAAARDAIRGQRRRVCEDLGRIFPIAPVAPEPGAPPPPPLSFRICGVALPNTEYDPASPTAAEDALSAALGYVAHLVHLLQFYLCVPLPYPVSPFGSRSSVRDDISLLPDATTTTTSGASSSTSSYNYTYTYTTTGAAKQQQQHQQRHRQQLQRDFPLFLRGGATAQYRFDYAWFLLNKDVEALCAVGAAGTFGASGSGGGGGGLRVVDIRHTLPNLKYLLYVCSAGTDEVPERKRGGVRGLWAGRMRKSRQHHPNGSSSGNGWGSSSAAGGSGAAGFLGAPAGLFFDDGASSAGGSSRRGSADSEALGGGGGSGSGGGTGRLQDQLQQAIVAAAAHENRHAQPQPQPQQQQEEEQQQHLHVHSLSYSSNNGNASVGGAAGDGPDTYTGQQYDNIQQQPSPSSPSPSSSRTLGGGVGVGVEGLPFDEGGARLTLRTKGLRENVGAQA